MDKNSRLNRFRERYESGEVPWDATLPPPEVIDLVLKLPPGRALDLGCGYGRSSIFLAQNGWQVDGIDYVPQAVNEAKQRAAEAGVADHIHFHVASVTNLAFLSAPYDFALDIGCFHQFDKVEQAAYQNELLRLLRPEATFLLFAHLQDTTAVADDEPRWLDEQAIRALFAQNFHLIDIKHGTTQVGENPPWPSAWFCYCRKTKSDMV